MANLRQGALTHGGWRWMRRAELEMPWGEDVGLEIEEMCDHLLAKCGGEQRASLSALMRIRRVGRCWGFVACVEHWVSHRHGQAVLDKPGSGLVHSKHGRMPKALTEDYSGFYERMVKDIEALERDHFIEHKTDALPATPAEFLAGLTSPTRASRPFDV